MIDELFKKEKRAIEILKTFQPSEAYLWQYIKFMLDKM